MADTSARHGSESQGAVPATASGDGAAEPAAAGERPSQAVAPAAPRGEATLTCPQCAYNLRGLTEPRCPECGQELIVATPGPEIGLAFLACRIIALLLLVRGILASVGYLWGVVLSATDLGGWGVQNKLMLAALPIVGPALYLIPGVFLWRKAQPIAARMARQAASLRAFSPAPAVLTDIAFKVVGILVLVDFIPFSAHMLAIGIWSPQGRPDFDVPWILATGIKIALGLWLVLGTHGLLALIDKLRTAGTHKPPP